LPVNYHPVVLWYSFIVSIPLLPIDKDSVDIYKNISYAAVKLMI